MKNNDAWYFINRRNFIKFIASLFFISPRIGRADVSNALSIINNNVMFDFNKFLAGNKYDDYYVHMQHAIDICSDNKYVFYLNGKYRISKTLSLPSDLTIVGASGTLIQCIDNQPITILESTGSKNIKITGVCLDGNLTTYINKSFKRTIRFVNCNDITIIDFSVINNADWAISFEETSNIIVRGVKVEGGGRGRPGGRDGIHFLDCSNVDLDGANINSGDDCIGITSIKRNIENIKINNVLGSSDIGSIVIYNEEQYKDKTYSKSHVKNIEITNVSVKPGGRARDIVRIIAYNPETTIQNVKIENIAGESYNHAVYLGGIQGLTIKNVNVISYRQHGVYILKAHDVNMENVLGKSNTTNSFGINIYNSSNVKGSGISRSHNGSNRIYVTKSDQVNLSK